jgi:hypothetical protein
VQQKSERATLFKKVFEEQRTKVVESKISFDGLASEQGDQIGRMYFRPLDDYLLWAVFGKYGCMYVAHIFVATFLYGLGYASILTKMGWATFWASFSQNHLVTLLVSYKTVEERS